MGRVHEVVAGGDDAGDVGNARIGKRLVGNFQQTVIRVEFLHRSVRSAGLPLAYEPHVSVEVAQGAAEHHVVDVQVGVEVAGDAAENHGVRGKLVNQQLRGGGRIDQPHAAYRCGNLDDVRTEGVDRAGHDVKAALGGVRHMRERFGDQRHFLIQCANNSYSFHTHT